MTGDMSGVRIIGTEVASCGYGVPERVRQSVEAMVEQNQRPVIVIKASQPAGRMISEVIMPLEASGAHVVVDEDFAGAAEGIKAHRGPWKLDPKNQRLNWLPVVRLK